VHKGFQIPHHPLTQADKIPTNGSGQSIPVPGIANDTKVSNTTTKILPQQGMMNIHSDSMPTARSVVAPHYIQRVGSGGRRIVERGYLDRVYVEMGVDFQFVNHIGCGHQCVDVIVCVGGDAVSCDLDEGVVDFEIEVDLVVVTARLEAACFVEGVDFDSAKGPGESFDGGDCGVKFFSVMMFMMMVVVML
jgi:hypothetical protein